jgi:hypothetical protein
VTGQKSPLWRVAKRTTQRFERKFGTHPNVFIKYTDNGWTTENLIVAYINWLHHEVAKDCPCVLISDIYPSHRTDLVVATAEANDLELLFVPAGATGKFQPLDRRTFGELKARARAEFARRIWVMGESGVGYDVSVEILIRYWNAIPIENVQKASDII